MRPKEKTLWTPKLPRHKVYFNGMNISQVCLGFNVSMGLAMVHVILPGGAYLETTKGRFYRAVIRGKVQVEDETH